MTARQMTIVQTPLQMQADPDMAEQGKRLNEVAALVDAGRIRSTATEVAGKIDAAMLRTAHAQIESGSERGKIVLERF